MKILPTHVPGHRFYEDIKKTNLALDALTLESDPKVTLLDLWNEVVNADGTLKRGLFMPDTCNRSSRRCWRNPNTDRRR